MASSTSCRISVDMSRVTSPRRSPRDEVSAFACAAVGGGSGIWPPHQLTTSLGSERERCHEWIRRLLSRRQGVGRNGTRCPGEGRFVEEARRHRSRRPAVYRRAGGVAGVENGAGSRRRLLRSVGGAPACRFRPSRPASNPAPAASRRNVPGRCRANDFTSSSRDPGSRFSSQEATDCGPFGGLTDEVSRDAGLLGCVCHGVQLRREGADALGGLLLLRACLIRQVCLCLVKEILGVCLRPLPRRWRPRPWRFRPRSSLSLQRVPPLRRLRPLLLLSWRFRRWLPAGRWFPAGGELCWAAIGVP